MNRTQLIGIGAILGAVLCAAEPARAQGVDEFGPYGGLGEDAHLQSPQHSAFEVRIGPYRPNVDGPLSGTPYDDIFGNKRRFALGFELDWQALRIDKIGTLGPGVGIGTFGAKAKAPLTNRPGRSGEETRLRVLPTYLVGVVRIDGLATETKIPLAFYGKAGLGYALWWARGEEKLERAAGVVGKGSSFGYHVAAGAMFLLDAIDRGGALEMDASTGINSAYLFGEYFISRLDGFGGGLMDVGSRTWVGGLALEF